MSKAVIATELFDNTYALYKPGYGGASVTYAGSRSDGGKNYEALSITPKGGYAEEMWFDTATALAARQIIDFGTGPVTTYLMGYHDAGGLMVPSEQKIMEQSVAKDAYGHNLRHTSIELTYQYDHTEVNVDIDKHLAMPPAPPSDVSLYGGETTIPFTMRNFWITLAVWLNGKGPFEMMLDSGGRNILSPAVAWEAGAQDTGEIPQTGNVPMLKPMRYARVESMELSGATLKQQDFTVRGVGNIFTREGMIGYEVFERFITTIDCMNRQIILRLPENDPVRLPEQAESEAALPLMFDDTKPGIGCTIADTDATCIVDTGSALPLILSGPFTKANPSVQPPWYAGAYGGVNVGGNHSEVRKGPVSLFQIGPFGMSNVNTIFTTAANGALAFYPSALVGNPIWSQFDVTFDHGQQVLRLKPNSNFKK